MCVVVCVRVCERPCTCTYISKRAGGSAKSPFDEITFPPKINNKGGMSTYEYVCVPRSYTIK